MKVLQEFEHALLVERVANRALSERVSMEFDTPAALEGYLKDHPDADKSKHTVVKKQKRDRGGDEGGGYKSPAADPKFQKYLRKAPADANKALSKLHRLKKSLDRAESYRHEDKDRAKSVKEEIKKTHQELIGHAETLLKKVKSVWDSAPQIDDEGAKRVRTRTEHILKLMGDKIDTAKDRKHWEYAPHLIESADDLASFMSNAAASLMRFKSDD